MYYGSQYKCVFTVNDVLLYILMESWRKLPEDGESAKTHGR